MSTPARHIADDILAQVELLVMFHPSMQSGGIQKPPAEAYPKATHCWITANVYGHPGRSEFTGNRVLEDMRIEDGDGEDLEPRLSEEMVNDIANYVLSI